MHFKYCDEFKKLTRPEAQAAPVQEPSREQTRQIVEGLQRCHHPDSKHEFLRTWIRDWTAHKTTQPAAQPAAPLTPEQREEVCIKAEQAMAADPNLSWRIALITQTEAAHGITGDKT